MDHTLGPEKRAEALLAEMSLEEKMGQVRCYMPTKPGEYCEIKELYPHGVGHISCLCVRMLDKLEDAAAFQREFQKTVMAQSEHHIPAIFHMEGLCGALIPESTSFPSGIGRASSWDPQLEEKIAQVVSRQELACGITQIFAPVLDVSRDSRFGRQGETGGEDPTLITAMGTAYTKGIQNTEIDGRHADAVAKHFLGFHDSQGGIHGANCDIPTREIREIYAKTFQGAIAESGLKGIMPCYASINGEPVHASKELLSGLLRTEMGFEGLVVSDYSAVHNINHVQKVCESDAEAGLRAMEAGVDVELPNKENFNEELESWFRSGKADMAVLDRAVKRVLISKFRMGLFEHPYSLNVEEIKAVYHNPQDKRIALQSARESIILLKNDGLLPIKKRIKKIAIIGSQAATARIFFGGYTHFSMAEGTLANIQTMAGVETKASDKKAEMETLPGTEIQASDTPEFEQLMRKQKPGVKSLLEELQDRLPGVEIAYAYGYPIAGNDMSHHEEAIEVAKNADLVIMALGGKHGTSSIASMGEGVDGTNINLPICQDALIEKLGKLGKQIVGVHFNGRPISSDIADEYCNAILEAWNPAEMGARAIVDVLTGSYNPSGKLTLSIARAAGQIPVYYNHPNGSSYHQGDSIAFSNYVDMSHLPRYFFGHGLSYTTFAYSNLQIKALNALGKETPDTEVMPYGCVEISFDVKNTGGVEGTEIAQLYLKDRFASMTRPVQELGGFARVHLSAGEKKTIVMKINQSQLAFLDRNNKWKIEKGDIDVRIGASSEDVRLFGSYHIAEDGYIDGKARSFYANVAVRA